MSEAEHVYFTAEPVTPSKKNPDDVGGFRVRFHPKPRKNEDGTTSVGFNIPFLLISDFVGNQSEYTELVATILNENVHRFD
jgi:hypothetical protein